MSFFPAWVITKIYVAKQEENLGVFIYAAISQVEVFHFCGTRLYFHSGNANCHQLIVPVHPEVIIGIPHLRQTNGAEEYPPTQDSDLPSTNQKPGLSFFLHFHRIWVTDDHR